MADQRAATSIPRVDVVYLTYNANRQQPSISMDTVCTISLYELKKHRHAKRSERHQMSAEAYRHYRWYNCVLTGMLRIEDGPQLLQTFHWYIETATVDAFRIDGGQVCEAVSLIIGPEVEHWYCARVGLGGRSSHGSRVRLRCAKWENTFGAQAKARISDCLVEPPAPSQPPVKKTTTMKKSCKRLSLGTICEQQEEQ
uniref:Uncharacterized protein n=2 Tax=Culex tarsalis TaxID=7177 RepID=A0A1Q3EVA8_CULTA